MLSVSARFTSLLFTSIPKTLFYNEASMYSTSNISSFFLITLLHYIIVLLCCFFNLLFINVLFVKQFVKKGVMQVYHYILWHSSAWKVIHHQF